MQVFMNESTQGDFSKAPLPLSSAAVALGGFDALHLGHAAIIRKTVQYAKKHHLTSVVYLFCNLPRQVVSGTETPLVYTLKQRLSLLEEMGVDAVVADWFTKELQQMEPEAFVREQLKLWLNAAFVAAGFNYRFGKQGKGDTEALCRLAKEQGMAVYIADCVEIDGEPVSSTRVRTLLIEGKVEDAARCLGRKYTMSGRVEKGNQIGRTMGFPTANLALPKGILLPKDGVYVTQTQVDGKWYPSMTNVGARPTVEAGDSLIETHLLDFAGELYGKEISVAFSKYLREIVRFDSLDALQEQLETDLKKTKAYFE